MHIVKLLENSKLYSHWNVFRVFSSWGRNDVSSNLLKRNAIAQSIGNKTHFDPYRRYDCSRFAETIIYYLTRKCRAFITWRKNAASNLRLL